MNSRLSSSQPPDGGEAVSPFHRWANQVSEGTGDLPRVIQVGSGGAGEEKRAKGNEENTTEASVQKSGEPVRKSGGGAPGLMEKYIRKKWQLS